LFVVFLYNGGIVVNWKQGHLYPMNSSFSYFIFW